MEKSEDNTKYADSYHRYKLCKGVERTWHVDTIDTIL